MNGDVRAQCCAQPWSIGPDPAPRSSIARNAPLTYALACAIALPSGSPSVQSIVDKTYARVKGKGLSELKKKQYALSHASG